MLTYTFPAKSGFKGVFEISTTLGSVEPYFLWIIISLQIEQSQFSQPVYWSSDRGKTPLPFYDYRHLNVVVPGGNTLTWQIALPASTQSAILKTAIALAQNSQSHALDASLSLKDEQGQIISSFSQSLTNSRWIPKKIPLKEYAGQTITLQFSIKSDLDEDKSAGVFRYPHIKLLLDRAKTAKTPFVSPAIAPSNTDLNSQFVSTHSDDFQFPIAQTQLWKNSGLQPSKEKWSAITYHLQRSPGSLEYNLDTPLSLNHYSHFYFCLAAKETIKPRMSNIKYKLSGQPDFSKKQVLHISLLQDEAEHCYSYDLKLLERDRARKLTALRFEPINFPNNQLSSLDHNERNWITITQLRLIQQIEKRH